MPEAVGIERVDLARRVARALVRGLHGDGDFGDVPVSDVVDEVEGWFDAHAEVLAESTVDLGLLYADRFLDLDDEDALDEALGELSDEDLVSYQEARAAALEGRVEELREARSALVEAMAGSILSEALGLAIRSALPR